MHELMPANISQQSSVNHHPSGPDRGADEVSASNDRQPVADSHISEIERLAGYFVPISDIATILQIEPMRLRDLIADPESPESMAYRRGKAMAKVKIRAQEMELAGCGSPLGLQSVRENLLTMEKDED